MTDGVRQPLGVSIVAYGKLSRIKGDFLALTPEERLAFVEEVRARRIRPPAAVKVKEPKPPKEKKPRAKKAKPIVEEPAP